jgi:phosphoribosylanthranilate isomerase
MTRIKICGITNLEDAQCAADCGADAIGFVFAESPRRVSSALAREIMAEMEPFVTGVGVFVNETVEEVRGALQVSGCTVAQLHGDEDEDYLRALAPYAVIKALRVGLEEPQVRGRTAVRPYEAYRRASAILLDTYVTGQAGGTGRRFDPAIAAEMVKEGWRVIVAGGLTPENVGEVVTSIRPYGVDVSSGVEAAPGKKDHDKVARFIEAVRAAERGGR